MNGTVHPWNSPLVVFVVVSCLVLATGTFVTRELGARSSAPLRAGKLEFVKGWKSLAGVGHVEGDSSASVRVIVFADYQCPGCAALHELIKSAHDSLRNDLQVVTRHFPLSGHAFAVAAANAAECAAEQGKFGALEDVLYRQQSTIGMRRWTEFAVDAGISDTASFNHCVAENRHKAAVERDRSLAQNLRFAGTPVYVVNGQPYFGAPSLAEFVQQLRTGGKDAR